LQTDALDKAGCERLFTDHASGAKAHRPELDHMLDTVREGDTLVVWKLDRLGRSVQNLVDLMNLLQSRGVGFRSLTENMDTTTPGGVLVFNVFAAMAVFSQVSVSFFVRYFFRVYARGMRPVVYCLVLPNMSASFMRRLGPVNSMRRSWWMMRSMIAAASLSSAKIVPHLLNSMLVVKMMLRRS
jgi:hypothetical protein